MIINDFELIQTMYLKAKLKTVNSPKSIKDAIFYTLVAMISVRSLELRIGALNYDSTPRTTARLQ